MEVSLDEVAREMQQRYPDQFTICVQAVQIAKLAEALNEAQAATAAPAEDVPKKTASRSRD